MDVLNWFYISGMIAQLDHTVGNIVDKLKKTKQYNNTIIIFASDVSETKVDPQLLQCWIK